MYSLYRLLSKPTGNRASPLNGGRISGISASRTFRSVNIFDLSSTTKFQSKNLLPMCCMKHKSHCYHTEVEKEIVEYLDSEISNEIGGKAAKLPDFEGYNIEKNESEVILSRKFHNEDITITFNINGSLDGDGPETDDGEIKPLVARPTFTVDLKKPSHRMFSLACSFISQEDTYEQGESSDLFEIQEVAVHDGQWKESTYIITASVMEDNLYDMLLGLLQERGIDHQFVLRLQKFATDYDSECYINILTGMRKFLTNQQ